MQTKHITFYEYEKKPISGNFSQPEIDHLDYLSRKLVPGKKVFSISQREVKAKSFVGTITLGNKQIEILPKLLRNDKEGDSSILKNLMHMLAYTHNLDVHDADVAALSTQHSSFLEAYISIFAKRLSHLLKKNPPRRYESREENSPFVKGKILFSEHIKHNSINQSKAYCRFDEFTENNLIAQTFRYVSEMLARHTSNDQSKRVLSHICRMLGDVEYRIITPVDIKGVTISRRNKEFGAVFNMAKMFLSNSTSTVSRGKSDETAILFDMNVLFEEYVYELLNRNKQTLGIKKVHYQKGRRLIRGYRNIGESEFNNKTMMNTFTDIMLEFESGTRLIIDTKYKLLNADGRNHFGVSNADVYQVLAYKTVHSQTNLPAPDVVLIYPKNISDLSKEFLVSDENSIFISTIDLSISTNSIEHQNLSEIKKNLFKMSEFK
jgi:5-methylcytosine-specific restriction enzyme subunit McrC